MKKILALVVSVLLVMSMFAMGYAADDETTTKTITLTGGKAGHTYTLYQIFTGKVDTKDTEDKADDELTDIQWGADAPAAYKAGYETAASAAKAVATQNDARAFAQSLNLTGDGFKQVTLNADGNVEFTGLPEGYYVILDKNNNTDAVEGDYSSAIIVTVVDDVNGKLKGSAPTSEKKVKDTDDSTGVVTDWQDSADYDIGDSIPFQLRATTADNVNAYRAYHVTFQDKQSDGLNAPTSFTIKVLGQTMTLAYDATEAVTASTDSTDISAQIVTPDDGQTFAIKVSFAPKAGEYLTEGNSTLITVDYESVLNANAVVGAAGNPNETYIKYSNNPESTDDKDEGKTPEDKVIVFTFQPIVDKVDETGAALRNAGFTLYKEVPSTSTGAVKGSEITFADGVEHAAIKAENYYVTVGVMTVDASGATFSFKGIDAGVYVLVETTVPDGYNAWKSAKVTVSAEHSDGQAPALTSLTATAPFTANGTSGTVKATKKVGEKDVASGELFAEIENNSGTTLPSTGGIGTTLFYIGGGILVLAAVILLVTKRRMNAND